MNAEDPRFGGIVRLFGAKGLERLSRAHVCVVGLGGVGSWAVEALARSGLGALTLVDFDDVCLSNVNRQIHALAGAFGQPKVEAMAGRVQAINPDCRVQAVRAFFTAATAEEILATRFDYVVDAIDAVAKKCLLLARCRQLGLRAITAGAAGGRRDPTAIRLTDLAFSSHDRLLEEVRGTLRRRYGFPRGRQPFGVDCVFSPEPVVYPGRNGTICAQPQPGADLRLDCRRGYGTASFVTGAFGFAAAAHLVQRIASGL